MRTILFVILFALVYAVLIVGTAYFIVKKVFKSIGEDREVDFSLPQQ